MTTLSPKAEAICKRTKHYIAFTAVLWGLFYYLTQRADLFDQMIGPVTMITLLSTLCYLTVAFSFLTLLAVVRNAIIEAHNLLNE